MAEKRTIDINIKNNAGEAEKDFKSFNKAMDETTKSAKNLDATFEEVYGDLQPLTTRMGEAEDRLYELALAGDTASEEYQELLEKVGKYRKVQIQTDLAVDAAATTMGQKLGSALTGATSGFAATQGAMAVFGSESEALEQTLVKVQGALAIQQGVQGLATSYRELGGKTGLATKAQAAFNFVMNLNPIVLIATAIAAAIAALVAFTDVLDPVIDKMKQLTDLIGITNFEEKKLAEQRKKRVAERDKQLKQQITNLQKEREEIQKTLDLENRRRDAQIQRLKLQQEAATSQEEQRKLGEQIRQETLGGIQDELNAFEKTERKNIQIREKAIQRISQQSSVRRLTKKELAYLDALKKENAKRNRELVEQDNVFYQEINNKRVAVANERTAEEKARRKEANQRYKAWAKERLDAERKIQDLELSLMDEGIDKELEKERVRFERLIKDLKGTTEEKRKLKELYEAQEQEAIAKIRNKHRKKELEAEMKLLNDMSALRNKEVEKEKTDKEKLLEVQKDYFDRLATERLGEEQVEINQVNLKYDALVKLAEQYGQSTFHIEKERLAALDEIDKESTEKRKANAQALADAKNSIRDAQIANIEAGIALAKSLFGDNKKLQALAIAAESAVSIAKTIITTQAANAAATAQGAALGITTAGASVAAASALVTQNNISAGISIAAQIAAAAKGISALGGGASAPSGGNVGGGGASSAAVPNFNVVGDAATNQLAQIQQQPTQAFVVSGEVTSAQALDRNRVQNATL